MQTEEGEVSIFQPSSFLYFILPSSLSVVLSANPKRLSSCALFVLTLISPQYLSLAIAPHELSRVSKSVLDKDVDDLVQMDDINEAMIVHNLRKRFKEDKIYVCGGLNSSFFQEIEEATESSAC